MYKFEHEEKHSAEALNTYRDVYISLLFYTFVVMPKNYNHL